MPELRYIPSKLARTFYADQRGNLRATMDNFYGAGVDNYTQPPAENPHAFQVLSNVLPVSNGILRRRWGLAQFSGALSSPPSRLFLHQNDSINTRYIVTIPSTNAANIQALTEAGVVFNSNLGTLALADEANMRMVSSRSYAYFTNGSNFLKKWNSASVNGTTNWGIAAPNSALTVGAAGAGNITLVQGRNYFVVFQNTNTGHVSDLSPVSATTGALSSNNVPLSGIPTSGDSQVNQRLILATLDGGDQTNLYLLGTIGDNVTTTFTDNVPDSTLSTNSLYLQTDQYGNSTGVADNGVPPSSGTIPIRHKGRIYLANGSFLNFSKNLAEVTTGTGLITSRFEEAWPAANQLDFSSTAEIVSGLLSDGKVLYIGTQRHVRKLIGDSPANFQAPEIAFNNAGVLNQDVWQVVFDEGEPTGCMWLTPDFRVIVSDFNSCKDIGTPIQTTLNNINTAVASSVCCATFVSTGAFDLYILGIPTGGNTQIDTLCVWDMRNKKWYTWTPTTTLLYLLFNVTVSGGAPQFLASTPATTALCTFNMSSFQDNWNVTPNNIPVTVRTTWLSLNDPTAIKVINEMEVKTSDFANMLITVEGAKTVADFSSPTTIISNASLVSGPLGDKKLYLASSNTAFKFYRFTFTSTSNVLDFMDMFSVEYHPFTRI